MIWLNCRRVHTTIWCSMLNAHVCVCAFQLFYIMHFVVVGSLHGHLQVSLTYTHIGIWSSGQCAAAAIPLKQDCCFFFFLFFFLVVCISSPCRRSVICFFFSFSSRLLYVLLEIPYYIYVSLDLWMLLSILSFCVGYRMILKTCRMHGFGEWLWSVHDVQSRYI